MVCATGVVRRRSSMSFLTKINSFGGRDLAVDLGTANTLVYVPGEGIVVSEPSVVALDTDTGAIHAVGDEAKRMIGRTPAAISAVRPLRHGVIADFDVTEQMLRHFIGKVQQSRFAHPRVVMCAPSGITDVERRAVEEACRAAGARRVHLIEEPIAAAIGAGLPIEEPTGQLVVDVGGGTTEVALISLGGIVVSRSVRVGGYDFDEAISAYIKTNHRLAIGQPTAERVKLEIGSAAPLDVELETDVRGRESLSGLPKRVTLGSEEIRAALADPLGEVIAAVREALEVTPPELASDISEHGIMLAGGGTLLRGFGEVLQAQTGMPTYLAKEPLSCVVLGSGRALGELGILERAGHSALRPPLKRGKLAAPLAGQ
jgi:rod shape-determining protein MreB and related proteins